MSRAEKIKADIIRQKDEGTYHTQININVIKNHVINFKIIIGFIGE